MLTRAVTRSMQLWRHLPVGMSTTRAVCSTARCKRPHLCTAHSSDCLCCPSGGIYSGCVIRTAHGSAGLTRPPGGTTYVCTPAPSVSGTQLSRRHMWRMLNVAFNRPDRMRIKEVGADMACAEWLLKCGAQVRWVDSDKFHTEFNSLPKDNTRKWKIEEIIADGAAVMDIGFEHLTGVSQLRKMRLHHCQYLEDSCLTQLHRVRDSLQWLEISSCGDVTDEGLKSLTQLTNLKTLHLKDLPEVRHKAAALDLLQKALPNCHIEFADIRHEQGKT